LKVDLRFRYNSTAIAFAHVSHDPRPTMAPSRGSLPFAVVVLATSLVGTTGCRVTDPTAGEDPGGPTDSAEAGPDVQPDGGDNSTGGIPDRIATAGGAGFTGGIAGGQSHTLELVAEQGDTVVMHLRRADGTDWQPAVSLFRSEDERIAWHEPDDDGSAHIPYRDGDLSDGWEFYEAGTYRLELRNLADSSGTLQFELDCLGGPCTSPDDGAESDDLPDSRDNCPSEPNPDQANRDHDLRGDACDADPDRFDCPADLSGADLELRLRAACTQYQPMEYSEARDQMFSRVDNNGGTVEAVYTGETIHTTGIPDPDEYNTEHTWPRSKMNRAEKPTLTDLNHLFPSDRIANEQRSNLPFDLVTGDPEWSQNGSKRGPNDRGWKVFEPRDAHKGDAARALFYYSVIYERDIDIDAENDGWGIGTGEEATLREWHDNVDPVDRADRERNATIQEIQGNRNPFVDCPGLVDQIPDF